MTGFAALTLNGTAILNSKALGNGGGICTALSSVLHILDDVDIRHCLSRGLGGGILAGGANLIVDTTVDKRFLIDFNKARDGGGIAFMELVVLGGEGETQISNNLATGNGGGLWGFSSSSRLKVTSEHRLTIQGNVADNDGGGIGLDQGAQFLVSPPECSAQCLGSFRNNGRCDHVCLTAGCNWDDGECNELFLGAGADALKPCGCALNFWISQITTTECDETSKDFACFSASCDWVPYGEMCKATRNSLAKCPLFDAVTYKAVASVPGLVYVKEGKGFTTPPFVKTGGQPFPYQPAQGIGRCVNAVCRDDPPPMTGIRDLDNGEQWCDTIGFGSDQVLQVPAHGLTCYVPPSAGACDTVGKAWAVCSDKPRLPSLAMNYEPADLTRLLALSQAQLFAEYKGCGSVPVLVRANRAGRFGGGAFKAGCDIGLERKGLCWVGGVSERVSSSFMLSFAGNKAGSAGGAAYSTCYRNGKCQAVITKTTGLPTMNGVGGEILSFLSNEAGGYGNSVATAPSSLIVEHYQRQYVPGMSSLNLTFSLRDAQGEAVKGSSTAAISHMVQILVLPSSVDCVTFESCEAHKLQPSEAFRSSATKTTTSLLLDFTHEVPLRYCQVGVEDVKIHMFVSRGPDLDAPAHAPTLQQIITVTCKPCRAGWSLKKRDSGPPLGILWTCQKCGKKQYIIDSNKDDCQPCAKGATCEQGAFKPSSPTDSVWNATGGVYRIVSCPPGYVLIRDEQAPVLDRCILCAADTYSVEEAVFGERLWGRSIENFRQFCHPCPRSKAKCGGGSDIRPLPGYWSPLIERDLGSKNRREVAKTAGGRTIDLYRCYPPTACVGSNESHPRGLCMPGAYGPLCGICNVTAGYAKSKDGCRQCEAGATRRSTAEIAVWTAIMGVPIFVVVWYFFALRPLVSGPEEETASRPERTSMWGRVQARLYSWLGRVHEHRMWRKTVAWVEGPAQALASKVTTHFVNNKYLHNYTKIIISFYQVATAFSRNIDVQWPDSITSIWKSFSFLTLEIFKLHGYDCLFGGNLYCMY